MMSSYICIAMIIQFLSLYLVGFSDVIGCYGEKGYGTFDTAGNVCGSSEGRIVGIENAIENQAVSGMYRKTSSINRTKS